MRSLVIGASLLAVLAPAAYAQEAGGGSAAGSSAAYSQAGSGRFLVFFDFNRSTLDADGRQVVAQAAEAYRTTGNAQVAVTGHSDTAGADGHNQALSQRRADAVRRELVRLGVPGSAIVTTARGESEPLVPTGDGVPEARNRRVEIEIPGAGDAPGATPVAEAAPAPPPPSSSPSRDRSSRMRAGRGLGLTVGALYGHNFRESDAGTENDLVGAELTLDALPNFLGGLSLKQAVLWSLNSIDEGLTGRSVVSLNLAPDLGFVRPRFSINFGGVYGEGVQDGLVVGPELGLDLRVPGGLVLRPKVAYDYQFRNPSWDDGILWAGVDLGLRF